MSFHGTVVINFVDWVRVRNRGVPTCAQSGACGIIQKPISPSYVWTQPWVHLPTQISPHNSWDPLFSLL